jgi:hypothetical protein
VDLLLLLCGRTAGLLEVVAVGAGLPEGIFCEFLMGSCGRVGSSDLGFWVKGDGRLWNLVTMLLL